MTVVIDSSLNHTSQRYGGYSDNLKNDNKYYLLQKHIMIILIMINIM